MKAETMIEVFCKGFKQKCEEFRLKHGMHEGKELHPEDCGMLESMFWDGVAEGGVAAMRDYVESCEKNVPAIRVDGERMRFKAYAIKEFHVGFGIAVIKRRTYQSDAGGSCVAPLDMKFNVVDEFAFPSVRQSVLHEASLMTPEAIVSAMDDWHVRPLSATAIKRIVSLAGARTELLKPELSEETSLSKRVPAKPLALVASMDGTCAPVRIDCEGSRYSIDYKVAMCGAFGIYGELHVDDEGRLKMNRLASSALSRMPEEGFPTFRRDFDKELSSVVAKLPSELPRIFLCDGASPLWNHARQHPLYRSFKLLIDFYHMEEHLAAASVALFGEGSKRGFAWTEKWKNEMLTKERSAKSVVRSMEYYAVRRKLSKSRREALAKHHTYFKNNWPLMNYAWFVQRGLPIGSGPVESCCKVLIKQRLCLSGMSWSEAGGQAILTLRAQREYGDWNVFWSAYDKLLRASMPALEEDAA